MATNNSQQRLAYSINQPLTAIFNQPVISRRAPTPNDKQPLGTIWVDRLTNISYIITSVVNNQANWALVTAAAGALSTLTSEDSLVAVPSAGNIDIIGDGNVNTALTGPSEITVSIIASPTFAGTVTANAVNTVDLTVTGTCGINSAAAISVASSFAGAGAIALNASAGGITLAAFNDPIVLSTTDQDISLEPGTGNIELGVTSPDASIQLGNVNGSTDINIGAGSGGLQLFSAGVIDIDCIGALIINSLAGAISIGNLGSPTAINIGTGLAATAVTVGNAIGATQLIAVSGTAGTQLTSTGTVTLSSAGRVSMVTSADTQASPTVASTVNARVFKVTFTGFTTAAGNEEIFTINNSTHTAGAGILLTVQNLGTVDCQMQLGRVDTQTPGVIIVTVFNHGSAALNGNIIITGWVLD